MNLTEFSKAKEKLNKQLRDGSITKQAHNRAMKKLTSSADAAKKGEFKNTSVGKFMKWLTTPAPLSEILGGRKTRKSTVKTAASEDIGAKPAATRQKVNDRTKSKRKAPSFDPTLLKLPKSKTAAKKSGITAPTSKGLYTIKSGDTLSQIAKAKGTTVIALKNANNIKDVDKIRAGRKLKIPAHAGQGKNPYAGMKAKKKAPKMSTAEMEAKLKKRSDDLRKAKSRAK